MDPTSVTRIFFAKNCMKIAKKSQVFSTKSDVNFYNFEISILIKRFKNSQYICTDIF
jgi:hypothetical protein